MNRYGAQSMTMVTVATVILEFKEVSVAEIALANTGKKTKRLKRRIEETGRRGMTIGKMEY